MIAPANMKAMSVWVMTHCSYERGVACDDCDRAIEHRAVWSNHRDVRLRISFRHRLRRACGLGGHYGWPSELGFRRASVQVSMKRAGPFRGDRSECEAPNRSRREREWQ